jgi:hypothetical protein
MLTITISEDVLEEAVKNLALAHGVAPEIVVQDCLAVQLGHPEILSLKCRDVCSEDSQ